jgi:hypothetical protein
MKFNRGFPYVAAIMNHEWKNPTLMLVSVGFFEASIHLLPKENSAGTAVQLPSEPVFG